MSEPRARTGSGARGSEAAGAAAKPAPARARVLPSWLPPLPAAGALAVLLGAAALLYLPVLGAPFFADDYLFLDHVRHRSLIEALAAPDPLGNFFRPVGRSLYFWLVGRASGESPVAFHAVNLGLFLALLALLFGIARRLGGARVAVIATAIVALGHAAEVPVRWAAGSQELIAVVGALAAIRLHLAGRRVLAAVALLIGALSKETVLVTPLVAALADRRDEEPWWRAALRAWPLGVAVAAWGVLWLAFASVRPGESVQLEPIGLVAAPAHLVQTILGLEWGRGAFGHLPRVLPPLVPLALALATVWIVLHRDEAPHAPVAAPPRPPEPGPRREPPPRRGRAARREARAEPPPPRPLQPLAADAGHARAAGIAWALLATLPIVVVTPIWSAYYYLFASCGAALAIAAWLARATPVTALAVVAALAWGAASARSLDQFEADRTSWSGRSHINRHYIQRATAAVDDYLASLRRQRPTLPPRSTLFFGDLKGNVAFQTADGPLIRWAYRDSSLRSYFFNHFALDKVREGPVLVFLAQGDTLDELEPTPALWPELAFGMIVNERPQAARDALTLALREDPAWTRGRYWSAWPRWALGDTAGTVDALRSVGATPGIDASAAVRRAFDVLATGDTLAAIDVVRAAVMAQGLDPGAHALLADLLLVRDQDSTDGAIEAYATRVLVPEQAYAWRRWGMIQSHHERHVEALASFERYFQLLGAGGEDPEARRWMDTIRGMLRGGDLAAEGARE